MKDSHINLAITAVIIVLIYFPYNLITPEEPFTSFNENDPIPYTP